MRKPVIPGFRRRLLAVGLALSSAACGCRRSDETPSVPGATHVVPAEAVRLFVDTPVSTKEFEDAGRRWTQRVWPRFDRGRIHSFPTDDGGAMMAEAPPTMAFLNRGADCGPAAERRVCVLPWDKTEITVCGRPLDGHLGLRGDRLSDALLMICREIAPARVVDGAARNSERDCTRAAPVPITELGSKDLVFRVGETAIVAGSAAALDPAVCDSMPWRDAGSTGPE